MDTLLFLLAFSAMLAASYGRRGASLLLFGAGLLLSAISLARHATSTLPLEF